MTNTILEDLYRHNRWANAHIARLCGGLSDEQLDEPRELGFGSLRNTLFHILAAEEVWLDRWTGIPPKPFPVDAQGLSIAEITMRLATISDRRAAWLEQMGDEITSKTCTYTNLKGVTFTEPFRILLLHVANHGIHHRAQALSYLKSFGKTIRGGLDYLFFRMAYPYVQQDPSSAAAMRQFGLEIETGSSPAVIWDADLVQKYFQYGDWCNQILFDLVETLDDSSLDRNFGMGMGSIRKTLLHLFDAEQFWLRNWTLGETQFCNLPPNTSLAELRDRWSLVCDGRNQFIAEQNEASVSHILQASFGGPPFKVVTIESMIQLCCHGTHHRAQLSNMLRHTGTAVPATDVVVWNRQLN